MIKESIKLNCLAVLWNPPFYFKNLNDEGIINFYSACLNHIEDKSTLKVILYHFPANTCVPITHNIIDKLYAAYPENILGVKDSSFSFEHTLELIQKYPQLKIYVGKDTDTSELVRHGACGAIVALSNVVPNLMRSLYDYGKDESKPNRNEEILKLWSIIGQHYLICSVKGIKASQENAHKWLVARPPLFPLSMEQAHELVRQMKEANVNK
jgi:4-hydroxy-tetrahydrodipicolinate synthase